ncbi:MAG: Rrf2 family transcriptional regulator [Mariprofundaceae bacterium]
MQLTMYTDYSLRVLLYLAGKPDERVTITEISEHFQISRNHLVKVVHNLGKLKLIHTIRGKSGGMILALKAEDINIESVIKQIEPHLNLLECFDDQTNTCPITTDCKLKGVIFEARQGFLDVLKKYTLADMLPSITQEVPLSSINIATIASQHNNTPL